MKPGISKKLYLLAFNIASFIRRFVVRVIRPKSEYFMYGLPQKFVEPISTKYGFDRGKPVDRYYIEKFMSENSSLIKGVCLEITDTAYTEKYGAEKVTKADALDINKNNKMATIYGDLRDLNNVESNTYDCVIITQTFVMIDDYESAIKECHRIIKPGGYALVTMPCLGPVWNIDNHFWRWTRASAEFLFKKYFPNDLLEVQTYGNALAGQCFWVGLSLDEISTEELEYNDKFFPVIVSVKVRKA